MIYRETEVKTKVTGDKHQKRTPWNRPMSKPYLGMLGEWDKWNAADSKP